MEDYDYAVEDHGSPERYLDEDDSEWRADMKTKLIRGEDNTKRKVSQRSKKKNSKMEDLENDGNEDEDAKPTKKRKLKSSTSIEIFDDKARKGAKKKKLKKKKTQKTKKRSKRRSREDGSSDGELIVDDPNSYYDTDEYDSEGKLIKRDEIKKKLLEDERMQRKLKRKPNTPHLVKKYTPIAMGSDGKPIMPISLRGLSILDLGEILPDKPKFHAKRYIWPVGFKSTRIYSSMTELEKRCHYTSEITINGDDPSFVVTCWEDKDNPIVISRPTPSGAWAEVGKRFFDLKKEVTGRDTYTQLSGPEMFGFAHPTIAKLIQEMPGAELCDKYQPQQFVPASAKIKGIDDAKKKGKRGRKRYSDEESDSEEEEETDSEYESSSEEGEAVITPIQEKKDKRPIRFVFKEKSAPNPAEAFKPATVIKDFPKDINTPKGRDLLCREDPNISTAEGVANLSIQLPTTSNLPINPTVVNHLAPTTISSSEVLHFDEDEEEIVEESGSF